MVKILIFLISYIKICVTINLSLKISNSLFAVRNMTRPGDPLDLTNITTILFHIGPNNIYPTPIGSVILPPPRTNISNTSDIFNFTSSTESNRTGLRPSVDHFLNISVTNMTRPLLDERNVTSNLITNAGNITAPANITISIRIPLTSNLTLSNITEGDRRRSERDPLRVRNNTSMVRNTTRRPRLNISDLNEFIEELRRPEPRRRNETIPSLNDTTEESSGEEAIRREDSSLGIETSTENNNRPNPENSLGRSEASSSNNNNAHINISSIGETPDDAGERISPLAGALLNNTNDEITSETDSSPASTSSDSSIVN
jgi:hypothetical protein